MKKLAILAFFLSLSPAFTDDGFLDAVSPFSLSRSPSTIADNPASAAGNQRIALDLGYIPLLGLGSEPGLGHAVHLGLALPTRSGVLTAAARFAASPFPSAGWGTFGALDFAFAKDLFPDFHLGLGVRGIIGGNGTAMDWGLGADLGAILLLGDIGFLKDFRLGLAMRNMGKGYLTMPAFTPALGASFALVRSDAVSLTASPDLSFPSFRNLRFTLPLQLAVSDFLLLDAAGRFDLREVLGADPARSVPVSLGLSFRLKADLPGDTGFLARPVVSAAPLANGILGLGFGANVSLGVVDVTPPRIGMDAAGTRYISPNFDGVQDDLTIPVSLSDDRVVDGYAFVVRDAAGAAVRTIGNKEERPRSLDWGSLAAAFLHERKGVPVPETIRWDGRTDAGAVAADGTYRYSLEAWDDNGNRGRSAVGTVVVDTVPPEVRVRAPFLIFSPNGDGNRDAAVLEQTGSSEDLWEGAFLTVAGEKAASFRWENAEPGDFEWDGGSDGGAPAPDGVYSYRVAAVDRAGNAGSFQLDNLIRNGRETPIRLSVDLSYFSPNGDGAKDAVAFRPEVPATVRIESWSLAVRDGTGAVRRTMTGAGAPPPTVPWDGRDDGGTILPEGAYRAELAILYVNGNRPTALSPAVVLDLTAPTAAVKADPELFSPDGDGLKDAVTIEQKTSDEVFWTGTLAGAGERDARTWIWRGRADPIVLWDGGGDDGSPVPDGTYAYVLSATDRAGNRGASAPLRITVDARPTPLAVSQDPASFSPNGDGFHDTIRIAPALGLAEGIESWTYGIRGTGGDPVRTVSGRDGTPDPLVWDGRDGTGRTAPDGPYYAQLGIVYAKGNRPEAAGGVFTIDTAAPSVSVRVEPSLFSPDGDGNLDTVTIRQSSSDEELWVGEIRDGAGAAVRSWSWKGRAGDAVWDGRGDDGRLVPDGAYAYGARCVDRAGNAVRSDPVRIVLDTRETPVRLSTDRTWFSPNGDGNNDVLTLIPALEETEGAAAFAYRIRSPDGATVRTLAGTGAPARTAWDGLDDTGREALPDGAYTAELEVSYAAGQRSRAASDPFHIDTAAPRAEARAEAGPFSPDGDGNRDTVAIRQSSSVEDRWEGEIRDAAGGKVRSLSWQGGAADFAWDGSADGGGRVPDGTYVYAVRAVDRAGNAGGSAPLAVTVDTRPTPVRVAADLAWFSPNGDGVKDAVRIVPVLGLPTGIAAFAWRIRSASGAVVRTVTAEGRAPAEISWDGRDDAGRAVPDGSYKAELEVRYAKGNRPRAESAPIHVDTSFPAVTLSPDAVLFSPEGDGRLDFLTIAQTSSEEDLWEAEIRSARGEKVQSWYWKGRVPDLVWDGRDENGNGLPDGAYSYAVRSVDRAGNAAAQGIPALTIDTRAATVFVTADSDGFSPNGDGLRDTMAFSPHLTLSEGVRSWKLSMVDAAGGVPKVFSGEGPELPEVVAWDGTASAGGTAPEGLYAAVLQVDYSKGDLPEARTSPFLLNVTAPRAEILLSPRPFSPDNDGVDDELSISLGLTGRSAVDSWEVAVLDPMGRPFSRFSGKGTPAERILWDGLSDKGELVMAAEEYPVVFTVKDVLGNAAVTRAVIAVDVLVIRDGQRLKVRISSITFAPDKADFTGAEVEADKEDRNVRTIKRLAEIFAKFPRYRIRIEGHAASVYWDDPKRAAAEQEKELVPLSRRRADSIKAALVKEGIDASRITTEGIGGAQPVVPHGDLDNRWKNRRVEFLLVRD